MNNHFSLTRMMLFKKNSLLSVLIAGWLLFALFFSQIIYADTPVQKTTQNTIPLRITSDKQSFDLKTNTATFEDHVIITRGSEQINADKAVLVKQPNGQQTVDATGKPVTFKSQLNNGKIVTGSASQLYYDVAADTITLRGDAMLQQNENKINGQLIHYSIKKEEMTASGGKNQQVSTTIIPNELQHSDTQKNKVKDGKISR